MDLKKLFALAAIPALALTLAACGGKKPGASGSAAASAQVDKNKVSDKVKAVVATAPEYKEFDEANQCWVVKSGADKYCLAPYMTADPENIYRDNNKVHLSMVLLQSKGKLVNGQLDEHTDGGVAAVVVDDNGKPYAKMPFTKLWQTPKKYGSQWSEHRIMGNQYIGNDVKGFEVTDKTIAAWPQDEKPGTHNLNAERKTYEVTKFFALEGDKFRQVGKLRTGLVDSKADLQISISPMYGDVDPATGYKVMKLKLSTVNPDLKDKEFEVKYNAAKKAYDFPQELRKIMKE